MSMESTSSSIYSLTFEFLQLIFANTAKKAREIKEETPNMIGDVYDEISVLNAEYQQITYILAKLTRLESFVLFSRAS